MYIGPSIHKSYVEMIKFDNVYLTGGVKMLKCQFTKKLQNTNAQIISKEKYINSKNDMNKRTVAPK